MDLQFFGLHGLANFYIAAQVLVLGGSSGTGHVGVQLAKALGADSCYNSYLNRYGWAIFIPSTVY